MAKIALLIGVSEYPSGDLKPLRNAINDAKAMKRILNHPEMGAFDEVKLLENPEKKEMEKELASVGCISGSVMHQTPYITTTSYFLSDMIGLVYDASLIHPTRADLIS